MPAVIDRAMIRSSVLAAIDELNAQLPMHQRVVPDEQTRLYGKGASLDSLGLVNLIVTVEARLATELDVNITLADEKAMSRQQSPFRSVGTLIDYAAELVMEDR